MAWYRTGTVAVTNGARAVTGSGTSWVANAQAGDLWRGPDFSAYEIEAVNSDTSILLAEDYRGTTVPSGGAYAIAPTQGRVRDLTAAVLQSIADSEAVVDALTVSSGRVGLGKTPNASAKLDVAGQVWVDAPSGDATVRLLTSSAEKGKLAATTAGRVYVESNGAEVMTWLNGNVGVGTSAPTTNGSTYRNMELRGSGGGGGFLYAGETTAKVRFGYGGTSGGALVEMLAAEPLIVKTSTVEALRVNPSGNVGIGTATPAGKLDVLGNIIAKDGANTLEMGCVSGGAYFQSYLTSGTGNAPLVFFTGVTIRAQIDAAGNWRPRLQTAAPTLAVDGEYNVIKISNTVVRHRMRGSDGVTRYVDLTLSGVE